MDESESRAMVAGDKGTLVVQEGRIPDPPDLFEARRVIESALMQRLARNITAKQIAELRAFVAEEQRAYDRGDRKAGQRLSNRHAGDTELRGELGFARQK